MKTFKKLTSAMLTAMLVLSMGVTSVYATDEALVTKNKNDDFTAVKSEASATTESAQVEVHKGDVVNLWVELNIPNGKPDVTGWTVDMYYDDAIFDINSDIANGKGFATGTEAVDYALGMSDKVASLPGGNIIQSSFRAGEASFSDINYYGFKYAGNTTKLIGIQLEAVADGKATVAYKMRDIVDSNYTDTYYVNKTTYQPMNGANFDLKCNVICNYEDPNQLPKDKVGIFGDVNVDFKELETNVYTGSVDLQAGTYKFRVNEFGKQMCFGYEFTDNMNNTQYSPSYTSATTFKATGGRYTFTYNTATDKLSIKFKPFADLVELFGDINVELVRTSSTSKIYTGSARVEAGTYEFRINDQGVQKCFGYTFQDAVVGAQYNPAWKGATVFNATGGIYSVKYDASTNKLTFQHATPGVGDVRVFGDVNIDLVKDYGTYYSATQTLETGTYEFRVDAFGKTLCNGSEFVDYIGQADYKDIWKSATKFTAKGGKYTFRFDSATNKLTVLYAPLEKKVAIFGDIELELKSTDNNKYTGKVELAAGKYTFRVDDFGTTYCCGATIKDSQGDIQYSSSYKAATVFEATGGTYGFVYVKNTHKLTIYKMV